MVHSSAINSNSFAAHLSQRLGDLVAGCSGVVYCTQTGNDFIMHYADMDSVDTALKTDIVRHSCAMYTSVKVASDLRSDRNAQPWVYICFYYSGFYAAHLLLRYSGNALVGLKGVEAKALTASLKRIGMPATSAIVSRGVLCKTDLVTNQITLTPTTKSSHEATWSQLEALVARGKQSLPRAALSAVEIEAFDQYCDALVGKVCGAPGADGLSAARNAVNYRFARGLWFPSDFGGNQFDVFQRGWLDPDALSQSAMMDETECDLIALGSLCGVAHRVMLRLEEAGGNFGDQIDNHPLRAYRTWLKKVLPS